MRAIAKLYYWAALLRRSRGTYDQTTLSLFKKACVSLDYPTHHLAYARLYRDMHGGIDKATAINLQLISGQSQNDAQKHAIAALLYATNQQMNSASDTSKENISSEIIHNTQLNYSEELATIDIMQSHWREQLTNFIAQKTIAVVGNSPSLSNSNFGAQIDQHDIVCRFNRYPRHASHAPDVGKRIDIWITSPEVLNEHHHRK